MNYLKLFQNHSGYEEFVSGGTMVKPNVSHCIQENEVHYNAIVQQNAIDKLLELLELNSIEDLSLWSYGGWLYAGASHGTGDAIMIT